MRVFRVLLFLLVASVASFAFAGKDISSFQHPRPVPIPEFFFKGTDGKVYSLNAFRGKVLLVNFWATWCAPCVKELPALDALATEFKNSDVVILPISLDRNKTTKDIEAFYKKHKITNLPIYVDDNGSVFRTASLKSLPTTIVVNQNTYEIARVMGILDWEDPVNAEFLADEVNF